MKAAADMGSTAALTHMFYAQMATEHGLDPNVPNMPLADLPVGVPPPPPLPPQGGGILDAPSPAALWASAQEMAKKYAMDMQHAANVSNATDAAALAEQAQMMQQIIDGKVPLDPQMAMMLDPSMMAAMNPAMMNPAMIHASMMNNAMMMQNMMGPPHPPPLPTGQPKKSKAPRSKKPQDETKTAFDLMMEGNTIDQSDYQAVEAPTLPVLEASASSGAAAFKKYAIKASEPVIGQKVGTTTTVEHDQTANQKHFSMGDFKLAGKKKQGVGAEAAKFLAGSMAGTSVIAALQKQDASAATKDLAKARADAMKDEEVDEDSTNKLSKKKKKSIQLSSKTSVAETALQKAKKNSMSISLEPAQKPGKLKVIEMSKAAHTPKEAPPQSPQESKRKPSRAISRDTSPRRKNNNCSRSRDRSYDRRKSSRDRSRNRSSSRKRRAKRVYNSLSRSGSRSKRRNINNNNRRSRSISRNRQGGNGSGSGRGLPRRSRSGNRSRSRRRGNSRGNNRNNNRRSRSAGRRRNSRNRNNPRDSRDRDRSLDRHKGSKGGKAKGKGKGKGKGKNNPNSMPLGGDRRNSADSIRGSPQSAAAGGEEEGGWWLHQHGDGRPRGGGKRYEENSNTNAKRDVEGSPSAAKNQNNKRERDDVDGSPGTATAAAATKRARSELPIGSRPEASPRESPKAAQDTSPNKEDANVELEDDAYEFTMDDIMDDPEPSPPKEKDSALPDFNKG